MKIGKGTSRLLLAALLAALAAAHVVYWYLPRARPGAPEARTLPGRLLASDAFPVAVWIPFPHQNLEFLRREVGGDADSLQALARLAGLPAPKLPAFGPLTFPPSSEIAIAAEDGGERYAVCARVYPLFGAFARLAGRLADNPWLAGGEIYVEGRRVEIAWRDGSWMVGSPELPPLAEPAGGGAATAPALLVVEARQATHPLPSGRFRLVHDGRAFELASESGGARDPGFEGFGPEQLDAFLLLVGGRDETLGEPTQVLSMFSPHADQKLDLPRIAVIYEPGGERWTLPGEALLELAGRELRQDDAAGWSLAAFDSASLESALELAPRLAPLRDLDALAPAVGGRLVWGLWLDLDAGLQEVSRLVGMLSGVPIVPRRQLERWQDAETVLRPLAARYSRLTVVITGQPRALRLRLEPHP